uniref:Uncharacterized protein n=1 Tax=Alexandrium monilatum TaxID=311494 RepID=A0A7S4PZV6_9DINO
MLKWHPSHCGQSSWPIKSASMGSSQSTVRISNKTDAPLKVCLKLDGDTKDAQLSAKCWGDFGVTAGSELIIVHPQKKFRVSAEKLGHVLVAPSPSGAVTMHTSPDIGAFKESVQFLVDEAAAWKIKQDKGALEELLRSAPRDGAGGPPECAAGDACAAAGRSLASCGGGAESVQALAAADTHAHGLAAHKLQLASNRQTAQQVETGIGRVGEVANHPRSSPSTNHGNVFEVHHAETFNVNAVKQGSSLRAEAVGGQGGPADVRITDRATGTTVRECQMKCHKTPRSTKAAVRKHAQRYGKDQDFVVPDGQQTHDAASGVRTGSRHRRHHRLLRRIRQRSEAGAQSPVATAHQAPVCFRTASGPGPGGGHSGQPRRRPVAGHP